MVKRKDNKVFSLADTSLWLVYCLLNLMNNVDNFIMRNHMCCNFLNGFNLNLIFFIKTKVHIYKRNPIYI